MSMLTKTLDAIQKSLARPPAEYAEARARCLALAPHETPAALVATIRDAAGLTPSQREALVNCVLEEHHRTRGPFWQSVLLAAFEPTLTALRSRAGRADDEDWDQEVLVAFLEAAATVHGSADATRALRWLTEAKLKKSTRRDRRERRHAEYDDEKYRPPFGEGPQARLAAAEVMRIIEARGGRELLAAALATEVEQEDLPAYIARAYPSATCAERATLYTRLRLAKARVLSELRRRAERAASVAA
jgi:hypothetical protein